ncbi:MAG: histidine kinase, partial [Bdellovibrio sp.]|nr:histidine kinase [Bdellovibrio sp.]
GEGTGLGLPIVAKLMDEMQGEISVESIENKGTVFKIILKKYV